MRISFVALFACAFTSALLCTAASTHKSSLSRRTNIRYSGINGSTCASNNDCKSRWCDPVLRICARGEFHCNVEGCTSTTTRKEDMHRHMRAAHPNLLSNREQEQAEKERLAAIVRYEKVKAEKAQRKKKHAEMLGLEAQEAGEKEKKLAYNAERGARRAAKKTAGNDPSSSSSPLHISSSNTASSSRLPPATNDLLEVEATKDGMHGQLCFSPPLEWSYRPNSCMATLVCGPVWNSTKQISENRCKPVFG